MFATTTKLHIFFSSFHCSLNMTKSIFTFHLHIHTNCGGRECFLHVNYFCVMIIFIHEDQNLFNFALFFYKLLMMKLFYFSRNSLCQIQYPYNTKQYNVTVWLMKSCTGSRKFCVRSLFAIYLVLIYLV